MSDAQASAEPVVDKGAAAAATAANGTTPSNTDGKATNPAADARTMADGVDDSGQGDTTATEPPAWRDDWRERLAGNDEKELARLRRFRSPENVYKSLRELEKKQSAGLLKPTLPADASPEEVEAYRKMAGVPKEATPEAYGVSFPEGFTATEADQADLTEFLGKMHSKNAPPELVQEAWNTYLGIRSKADQQLYEAAQEKTVNQRAEIRAEFGRDFDRNLRVGNQFLVQHLGEEKAKSLTGMTLADGTKLGDHPDFVRLFTTAALATADDAALATAETNGSESVADAYRQALEVQFSDPKRYKTDEHQKKLIRLAAAANRGKAA